MVYEMSELNTVDWAALVLVIIGGLNWGLYGLMQLNVVQSVFASVPALVTVVYVLVALAAIYLAVMSPRMSRKR
jgi:hypothetical protein